ncbi:MAG: dynamin family protein [Bacillota bacterium]
MRKHFTMRLDEYTKVADALIHIASNLDNEALLKKVQQQTEKIRNTEFHVVVIGQFKRGKSTLINYFLEDHILPTGVVPITSIVTHIRYSKIAKVIVTFKNDKKKDVALETIGEYISEQENPQNSKQVDKIEIFYPSEILKNGFVLIDTPGIGSIYKHNTTEAYRYLPQADAAIFLFSSDAPISGLELEFLSEIKEHFNKIFFIQNKIDHLSETEVIESAVFSTNAISRHLGKEIKIYPLSAKLAFEGRRNNDAVLFQCSGMGVFEEELEQFLFNEKGDYLIKSYEQKISTIIKDVEDQINFQIDILNSPIETLEQQLEVFKEKAAEVTKLKKETLALIEMDLKELINVVEQDLQAFRTQNVKLIKEGLTNLYQQNQNMKFKQLSVFLHAKLEIFIEDAYAEWDREQKIKLREDYQKITKRFTGRLNEAIDFMNRITYEIFRLKMAQPLDEMAFIDKDTFYFKFGSSSPAFLAPKLKDFLFLLPKKVREKMMLSDVLDRVCEELEKNGNNLKWDYSCKIRDSKYVFDRVYQDKMNDILTEIEKIIMKTIEIRNKKSNQIEKDLQQFDRARLEIMKLREKMNALKSV